MDVDGFWRTYNRVMEREDPTDWLGRIESAGPPVPDAANPTEADLQALADGQIEIEQALAEARQRQFGCTAEIEHLNYYFSAAEGYGSLDPDLAAVGHAYDTAAAKLSAEKRTLDDIQQILTTQLALWAAARGKVEHDLQWQRFVADRYGADPNEIPRKSRQMAIDHIGVPILLLEHAA